MFNDSRDEELIDENLKNIYEKISNAIQSKNEIECSTAANAEKLIENENKLEEMEQILYKFRSQLTSNPILHEINKICQEDEALHRKSAEDIYEELKNISRIIDFFEMKNKNLHEKYSEGEQLLSLVTSKLDDQIECKKLIIKRLHSEELEVTNELKEEFEERKNNMKSDIEQLTKSIYDEEKDLAILLNDLEEGNILVQKSTEKGLKYKQDLSEMITLKQEITSSIEEDEIQFRKHESVLKHEIEEEVMKADDYKVKIGALKNKLNLQIEMNRIENEKLKSLKEIISKKVLHDLDKILKDNIAKGSNELCSIEEIIIVQEKIISDNKLIMKQFEDENIQLQMELDEQEKFKQKLNQEKIVRTEKNLLFKKTFEN
ncbi:hypothetical protein HHI36_020576 [Cryptolaemus montrouzieri]|uniref:Uncharacterized protein n=1 Tax=Cryptolaemus montrouzieri TaxID=559131 RepID=A0ABD2NBB7_9CUCU